MALEMRLVALASAVMVAHCTEAPTYPVRVSVPNGSPDVASVDLFVLRSCEEVDSLGDTPSDPMRSVQVQAGSGAASPTLGLLSKGSYALYGVARDEDCALFAAGCRAFAIPRAAGAIELPLDTIDRRGCGTAETCRLGRCTSVQEDGGPPDSSPEQDADANEPPAECGAESPCASSFRDDFEDGVMGAGWWLAFVEGCVAGKEAGKLVLVPPHDGTTIGPCVLHARGEAGAFDLRGDSITVEVPNVSEGAVTYLGTEIPNQGQAREDTQFFVLFEHIEGKLHFVTVPLDTPYEFMSAGEVSYSEDEHRWWRLREQTGTIYWDTSGDGRNWVNQTSAPGTHEVDLTQITVSLGVETFVPLTEVDASKFDNYNLPP